MSSYVVQVQLSPRIVRQRSLIRAGEVWGLWVGRLEGGWRRARFSGSSRRPDKSAGKLPGRVKWIFMAHYPASPQWGL